MIHVIDRAAQAEWERTGLPVNGTAYANRATNEKCLDPYCTDADHRINLVQKVSLRWGDIRLVVDDNLGEGEVIVTFTNALIPPIDGPETV